MVLVGVVLRSEHHEDAAGEGDEGDKEARGAGEVLCTEAE